MPLCLSVIINSIIHFESVLFLALLFISVTHFMLKIIIESIDRVVIDLGFFFFFNKWQTPPTQRLHPGLNPNGEGEWLAPHQTSTSGGRN